MFYKSLKKRSRRSSCAGHPQTTPTPKAFTSGVSGGSGGSGVLESLEPRLLLSGTAFEINTLTDISDPNDNLLTLREAITAANTNLPFNEALAGSSLEPDLITFAPALFTQGPATLTLNGTELPITDSLNIRGPDAKQLTLNANQLSRLFNISNASTEVALSGLTLTQGVNPTGDGGAVNIDRATLHLANTILTANNATFGGAIANDRGTLQLTNTVFTLNTADTGGAIWNRGTATLNNTTLAGNAATTAAGGIYFANPGSLTINNSIVAFNEAPANPNIQGAYTPSSSFVGVDPLFTRNPSTGLDNIWGTADDDPGDLRPQFPLSSPARDTGDNALLPIDILDLDNDNDTAELLPVDINLNPRVFNSAVDIGAYETNASIYIVDSLLDVIATDGRVTLREAIEAANTNTAVTGDVAPGGTAADLIRFDPTLTNSGTATITLNGTPLETHGHLELVGPGADLLTIDANLQSRVLFIHGETSEVTLSGLTFTKGYNAGYGAGVYNSGIATFTDVRVSQSVVHGYQAKGGGIFNGGTLNLTQSVISGNQAPLDAPVNGMGGGIYNGSGTLNLFDVTLTGNQSYDGGGLYSASSMTLTNTSFENNTATQGGGAVYANDTLEISQSLIMNNTATQGGGLYSSGTLTITDSQIEGNHAYSLNGYGGGYLGEGDVTLIDSVVTRNTAIHRGAGGYSPTQGYLTTIRGSIFSDNFTGGAIRGMGGAVWAINLDVSDSTFTGNVATGWGGGIRLVEGVITDTLFTENTAELGGGIFNESSVNDLIVKRTSFLRNSAQETLNPGQGGAIYSRGRLYMYDSIVAGNQAEIRGGGISNFDELHVFNSTFVGNTADLYGGGLSNYGDLFLTHSTVVANEAAEGGGTYNIASSSTFNNSIISLNQAPASPQILHWRDVINHNSLIDFDPQFVSDPNPGGDGLWGTLDDDYGDLNLTDTSVALNHGDNTQAVDHNGQPLTLDGNGDPRLIGNRVDLGAYEFQGAVSASREATATTVNLIDDIVDSTDGQYSIREALLYASFLKTNVHFDPSLAGATLPITQGQLEVHNDHAMHIDASPIGGITLDAGGNSRVLIISSKDQTFDLTHITFRGGMADRGGGLWLQTASTTITNNVFVNNTATISGGGLESQWGDVTIIGSNFTHNTANYGGGINTNDNGAYEIHDSVFHANTALIIGGGMYLVSNDSNLLDGVVFSNNTADDGAGAYVTSTTHRMTNILNSTFVDNKASDYGGGLFTFGWTWLYNTRFERNQANSGGGIHTRGPLTAYNLLMTQNEAREGAAFHAFFTSSSRRAYLYQSTIAGNRATLSGGGVYYDPIYTDIPDAINLVNSIVAHNEAPYSPDFNANVSIDPVLGSDPSFIHNPDHGGDGWIDNPATTTIDEAANNDPGNLHLRPNSPAIDAGDSTLLPLDTFDLDNDGDTIEPLPIDLDNNPRILGAAVDLGAFEYTISGLIDIELPEQSDNVHSHNFGQVLIDQTASTTFTLRNEGADTLNVSQVTGHTSHFTLTPLNSSDSADDWTLLPGETQAFTVSFTPDINAGFDTTLEFLSGDPYYPVYAITLSGFGDPPAEHYIVNTLTDISDPTDNLLTLREAITAANTNASFNEAPAGSSLETDLITFAPSLFTPGPATLTLNGTELPISDSLNITGPTTSTLTIDANQQSRIFNIYEAQSNVQLSNLTITGGFVFGYSAGIRNHGNLTLNQTHVTNNHAQRAANGQQSGSAAGGIGNSGTLTLLHSTVSHNSATQGGGISSDNTVTIVNSTLHHNSAGRGGAIINGGTLTIQNSALHTNIATSGGAIYNANANSNHTATINNTTITANTARRGAGIFTSGTLTLNNSTVTANSGIDETSTGAGIYNDLPSFSLTTINNSIVALNNAPIDPDIHDDHTANNSLITTDPLFVQNPSDGGDGWYDDPATQNINESTNNDLGDLRLRPNSLAINLGNNNLLPPDTFDIDNNSNTTEPLPLDLNNSPRIHNNTVDAGAYEYHPPAHYIVNTLTDISDPTDNLLSLREAITAANTNAPFNQAPAGSSFETDSITFDPTLFANGPAIITLNGTELTITDSLNITGPTTSTLTINPNNLSRAFYLSGPTTQSTLTNLNIDQAAALYDGRIHLSFQGGESPSNGGAIYNYRTTLTLNNVNVTNSLAANAAAIYNVRGYLTINNSTYQHNTARQAGSAILSQPRNGTASTQGSLAINNSFILNNSSEFGAAVGVFNSTLSMNNTIVSHNTNALGGTGGVDYDHSPMSQAIATINNSTISHNISGGDGAGGVTNFAKMIIRNSTISHNKALGTSPYGSIGAGGGIRNNYGELTIVHSKIIANYARQEGGGIFNISGDTDYNNSNLTLINSTIANNTSARYAGIFSLSSNDVVHPINITNSTITHNTSTLEGAAISTDYETVNLNNSIVALNQSPSNLQLETRNGSFINTNSLITTDPLFIRNPHPGFDGIWATTDDDHGDLRLLPDSLAINLGDNNLIPPDSYDIDNNGDTTETLPLDLFGNRRIHNVTVDAGAYEYHPSIHGDLNGNGTIDLTDADLLSHALNLNNSSPHYDLNSDTFITSEDGLYLIANILQANPADSNLDGKTNIADLINWAQNFGKTATSGGTGASFSAGDTNFDGFINLADLIHWAQNFDNPSTPSAITAPLNSGDLSSVDLTQSSNAVALDPIPLFSETSNSGSLTSGGLASGNSWGHLKNLLNPATPASNSQVNIIQNITPTI